MSDPDPLLWQFVLQLFLILFNAVFACAEIAIISINDNKLERLSDNGNKKARRLLSLTRQPAKFLATIQVGIPLQAFWEVRLRLIIFLTGSLQGLLVLVLE